MQLEKFIEEKEEKLLQLVRSELNVQKWVCLFATRHFKGRSRELVRRIGDKEIKIIIGKQYDSRGREIEVDVLRIPAYKVLIALFHIWEARGKPDGWITSSLYELAAVMNRKWGGKDAKLLKNALRSLADIPIRWVGFFSKRDGYIDIIEPHPLRFIQVGFLTRKIGDEEIDWKFKFRFDERIQKNLLLGYTKPLRLDVLSELDDISTLVYCHVDLVMADKNSYIRKSKELFEDLGLTSKRYRYLSRRKEALEKVIEELIERPRGRGQKGTPLTTGILTEISLRETKDGKDLNVCFVKEPFKRILPKKSEAEVKELVAEMERVLGVKERNRGFYLKIARNCPTDLIRIALKDTMEEARAGRITGSKAQFFGYWIQLLASNRGIDLGLRSSFEEILKQRP